jgi:hypothetical protein
LWVINIGNWKRNWKMGIDYSFKIYLLIDRTITTHPSRCFPIIFLLYIYIYIYSY